MDRDVQPQHPRIQQNLCLAGCNAQGTTQDEQPHANEDADAGKRKPKFGAFTQDTGIATTRRDLHQAIPDTKLKYVEFHCFTPARCHDHASQRKTAANEVFGFSYGITPDTSAGNSLTLKPVSALAHPGKSSPIGTSSWNGLGPRAILC